VVSSLHVNSTRRSLDQELVRRGLADSRDQARSLVEAGKVLVKGAVAMKTTRMVAGADPLVVSGDGPRFVSRGGDKLDAALERFDVAVDGVRAIDAGASTGGFTDCLLQRGARQVVAVDVGHSQLHEHLRADCRVKVYERTNIRNVVPGDVGGRGAVVVADLSFISLATVLPALVGLLEPGGDLVALVKPQFEASRREVSRGSGVVRDAQVWRRVLDSTGETIRRNNLSIMGLMVSPIHGAQGNTEFLIHARDQASSDANWELLVDEALDEART
jgi:23S rRNA (cytidine1920-2'-O)/16S rRNA (cytidine1409-2'-O)-methyltransferase